jgi:Flp pilus assembly protein TadG
MQQIGSGDSGQTVIEFGIVSLALFMVTVGLIDAGRAFFQYNAVADAARFGARWASVVGGTCTLAGSNSADWCTQQGIYNGGTNFWVQDGNQPRQGFGKTCPSYAANPGAYYTVSDPDNDGDNDYKGDPDGDPARKRTTIIGAIAQHFDTSKDTTGTVVGGIAGIDLTQLRACIATSDSNGTSQQAGDYITVTVYTRFTPASFLLGSRGLDLVATSTYQVEG